MKTCSKCKKIKNTADFFIKDKKSGRLHAQCKECYKEHRQSYYKEHYGRYRNQYLERAKKRRKALRTQYQQKMSSYLQDKSCELCDEGDMRVLEFDHKNPNEKTFTISQAVRLGYSWEQVLLEIRKCRILCANCHKKRTAEQGKWYKTKNMEAPTGIEPV